MPRYKWIALTSLSVFFFISFIPDSLAETQNKSIDQSISNASRFLITTLESGDDTLECVATRGAGCPVHETGHIFVEYFIQNALGNELPANLRKKIIDRINSERRQQKWLWGYNKSVVIDSDDTSFALQTLLNLKQPVETKDLKDFYSAKYHAYTTFITGKDTGPVSFPSALNNAGIHLDANANIDYLFNQLNMTDKINYKLILDFQYPDGSWEGYFYPGQYYSTYMSMRLLCAVDNYSKAVKKGLDFILHSQKQDGSWGGNPYDTSLALNTLLTCSKTSLDATRKGIEYLLRTQQPDGYWIQKNPIWQFVYDDEPLTIWFAYDSKHTLTTSLALLALKEYQSRTYDISSLSTRKKRISDNQHQK